MVTAPGCFVVWTSAAPAAESADVLFVAYALAPAGARCGRLSWPPPPL